MIKIISKKSTEFSDEEIISLYRLFKKIFNKDRTINDFKNQFLNTSLGYSFHALAIDKGNIIGHNVYIPFKYYNEDIPFILCLSVDAMLHPDYRGKGLYRKMLLVCEDMAKKEGCKLRIGFPNDNSYPVQINGFKYNDVGRLKTYCLPLNVSKFNPHFNLLEPLTKIISKSIINISKLSKSKTSFTYPYRKDITDFNTYRYKWFGNDYKILDIDGTRIVYKDYQFKDKPATFLIDVYPLNKHNFDLAVREVYNQTCSYTPMIIYVGNLPFTPISMVKIPHYIEPKHFHFVTKILDPSFIGQNSLNINNWDLNLSNFDLL